MENKMKLALLLFFTLPITTFANVTHTDCDIEGVDASFDLALSTLSDSGPRVFTSLVMGRRDHLDEKGSHHILAADKDYKIDYLEHLGNFSLKITSRTKHQLIFSAMRKTSPDGTVKTNASSSLKGFVFPGSEFTCQ
jgi:hypothetical protein